MAQSYHQSRTLFERTDPTLLEGNQGSPSRHLPIASQFETFEEWMMADPKKGVGKR